MRFPIEKRLCTPALMACVFGMTCLPAAAGGFNKRLDYSVSFSPSSIVVGDFNQDHKADVAALDFYGHVGILLGNGDGTLQTDVEYGTGYGSIDMLKLDFNRDGKIDLITLNDGSDQCFGSITLLPGTGNGTFPKHKDLAVQRGLCSSSMTAADLNHDGKMDLAVADQIGVSVLLGNGSGIFHDFYDYPVGDPTSGGGQVAAGDLNGDGYQDLAVTWTTPPYNNDRISILLGNGDGSFGPPADLATGLTLSSLLAADFNGDGHLDLAAGSCVRVSVCKNGLASIFLGNGDGIFQPHVDYAVGVLPGRLVAGDVNQDGQVDLVAANYVGGAVHVLLGNGDGTFQPPATYQTSSAGGLAIGDMNGDGSPDLVTSGSVLLNTGGTWLSATSSPNPSAVGDPVTLTITVTGSVQTGTVPGGKVIFLDGKTALGNALLTNGQASLTTSTLSEGTHLIRAKYLGDTSFNPHTSQPILQAVQ